MKKELIVLDTDHMRFEANTFPTNNGTVVLMNFER